MRRRFCVWLGGALAALILIIAPCRDAAAIAFVQTQKNDFVVAAASLTVTITATGAGHILVACGSFDSASSLQSLVDNNADTATSVIAPVTPAGETFATIYCRAFFTATTGTTSVTANFNGPNPTFADLFVWEISGLTNPATDRTTTGGGSGTTADSGSSGTLATAAEAAVVFCASGNACTLNGGAGWIDDGLTTHTGSDGAHQVTAATTALDATWAQGGTFQWGALIATFQSTSAPASATFRTLMGVGQ